MPRAKQKKLIKVLKVVRKYTGNGFTTFDGVPWYPRHKDHTITETRGTIEPHYRVHVITMVGATHKYAHAIQLNITKFHIAFQSNGTAAYQCISL